MSFTLFGSYKGEQLSIAWNTCLHKHLFYNGNCKHTYHLYGSLGSAMGDVRENGIVLPINNAYLVIGW